MNAEAIFAGLSDEAVVLVALLWESGATASGSPEALGVAERLNQALPALIAEELQRRELTPMALGRRHFTQVLERAVEALSQESRP
jgi:hypothetical protein